MPLLHLALGLGRVADERHVDEVEQVLAVVRIARPVDVESGTVDGARSAVNDLHVVCIKKLSTGTYLEQMTDHRPNLEVKGSEFALGAVANRIIHLLGI